jgi:hypothetical protein
MKIASRARVLALLATVAAVTLTGCGAPETTPPPVRADDRVTSGSRGGMA